MTEGAPKHVIIGITGGIAAYKTMTLIRLFKSAGCEVKVVATANALEFETPCTATLSSGQSNLTFITSRMPTGPIAWLWRPPLPT